jgi:omega-hydroxy-beta-dihydromenaquinone-9 sulfotransferase
MGSLARLQCTWWRESSRLPDLPHQLPRPGLDLLRLFLRLFRLTLFPPGRPAGPRTLRRLGLLSVFIPAFLGLQTLHWLGFLLDDILFRGYRNVPVREPLFIVGLPRSGTSFLQRILARDSERFTTLRLWELLLAPSVTERRLWLAMGRVDRALGRPLARILHWGQERGFRWMEAIHQVSLTDPEEDYFLLLPVFACFLLVVPFPHHEEVWRLARFDEMAPEERRPIMAFYRAAIQRHLYVAGPNKQLLSKNPSFTPFLRSLLETFPDGRIVCCVRDPEKVVPSLLSSVQSGADWLGYQVAGPRIRDRFLAMLEYFAQHALDTLDPLPDERYAYAPMDALSRDAEALVLEMYRRFGWEPGVAFRKSLAEEGNRGRAYTSRHRYTLEEFGLTAEDVRTRFIPLGQRFGFGKDAKVDGACMSAGREPAHPSPPSPSRAPA